jgi:hypothetical protein
MDPEKNQENLLVGFEGTLSFLSASLAPMSTEQESVVAARAMHGPAGAIT